MISTLLRYSLLSMAELKRLVPRMYLKFLISKQKTRPSLKLRSKYLMILGTSKTDSLSLNYFFMILEAKVTRSHASINFLMILELVSLIRPNLIRISYSLLQRRIKSKKLTSLKKLVVIQGLNITFTISACMVYSTFLHPFPENKLQSPKTLQEKQYAFLTLSSQ